jgi:hypothetical protein
MRTTCRPGKGETYLTIGAVCQYAWWFEFYMLHYEILTIAICLRNKQDKIYFPHKNMSLLNITTVCIIIGKYKQCIRYDWTVESRSHNLFENFDSLKPMQSFAPAAAMVYTDLETLRGLVKPTDYGSGIEYADGLVNSLFPGSEVGLQVRYHGRWLGF